MKMTFQSGLIWISALGAIHSVSAQTWMQATVPVNSWMAVAASTDGTKLVAGGAGSAIYISTNSGVTWTSNAVAGVAASARWGALATSADGMNLIAAQGCSYAVVVSTNSWTEYPGRIYASTNGGATWYPTDAPQQYWRSVTTSADGSKLAAVGYWMYASTNFGVNWTRTSAPGAGWVGIASSADGAKLAATGYGMPIYVSTNSGVTWTGTSSPNTNWFGIASSADGNKLAAFSYSLIYTSTNAGITWMFRTNLLTNGRTGQTIASSADGTKLAIAGWTRLCTSTDSGATWQRHADAPFFNSGYSVASSADGRILALAGLDGSVYVFSNPPPVLPAIGISTTNHLNQLGGLKFVALSWPSWASNVVVQQNSDLNSDSWTAVTNSPIQITNLKAQTTNYQVVLPLTGSQGFYRLNSR